MIINIRGTSGSGKSTAIRELFARASSRSHWQPDWSQINPDPRPTDESGKVKSRKRPWGYLLQMPTGKQVVVLGHYETACGGCDTLPSFDLGFALIRHAESLGFDVVYEGLLYSADAERTLALHREGRDLHVLGLNTPLDVCLASVNARRQRSNRAKKRAAAGKDPLPDVNPKNTESKFKGTQSTMKKLQEAGVDARWCTREECVAHLLHLLGGPLSDAEASLVGIAP